MGSKTLRKQKPARRSALPEIREAAARAPHLIERRTPPLRPDLAALAVEHLGEAFAVLEARGSDRLDFHEASVVGVRDLIAAAFAAGRKSERTRAEIGADMAAVTGYQRIRVRDHEFVDTTFDPDKREALAQLFALLDAGTPTDGILCIAPAGRVAALVKAVRA